MSIVIAYIGKKISDSSLWKVYMLCIENVTSIIQMGEKMITTLSLREALKQMMIIINVVWNYVIAGQSIAQIRSARKENNSIL
jgi:hypothetical protein